MIPLAKAILIVGARRFGRTSISVPKGLSCTNAGHEKAVAIQSAFTFKP